MSFFDIFAWVVLILLSGTVLTLIVFLGLWPGKVAKERHHPQAEAIAIGSWLTLLLGLVLWPLVVIWAYMKPEQSGGACENRLASLEARLERLESSERVNDGEGKT